MCKTLFLKFINYRPVIFYIKILLIFEVLWLLNIWVSIYSTGFFSVDEMETLIFHSVGRGYNRNTYGSSAP